MNGAYRVVHEDWTGQQACPGGSTGRALALTCELAPGQRVTVTAWEPAGGGPLRLRVDAGVTLDALRVMLDAAGVPDVTARQVQLF